MLTVLDEVPRRIGRSADLPLSDLSIPVPQLPGMISHTTEGKISIYCDLLLRGICSYTHAHT